MTLPALSPGVADALRASPHRIVVTGAGGWLGLATLELLAEALGARMGERVRCFGSGARTLALRGGRAVEQRPLAEIAVLPPAPTLLLHLAFLTKDRALDMDEDAYRAANEGLSRTVLDALDAIGVRGVFVASSGAARHAGDAAAAPAMRLYGTLKRDDEERFAAWAQARGRTAVIARVFNVTGPYMNKHEHYALASFINDALDGRAIEVRAPHRVVRGFVAIRELMSLVFALLAEDSGAVIRFETGGEGLELADVARAVAAELGGPAVRRAAITGERVDHYVGEGSAYGALLARHGIESIPFPRQIRETAEFLVAARPVTG